MAKIILLPATFCGECGSMMALDRRYSPGKPVLVQCWGDGCKNFEQKFDITHLVTHEVKPA